MRYANASNIISKANKTIGFTRSNLKTGDKRRVSLLVKLVLWAQSATKDYIRAEHTLHSIFKILISQVIIPQVMFKKFFFFSLFIFRGHSTREPASGSVTYFILRTYTGIGASHSQHMKNWGEVLDKNAGERTGGYKLVRKKSLAVGVGRLAIFWPGPGFKGRTFQLCVLNRFDFNFCVRGSQLRG